MPAQPDALSAVYARSLFELAQQAGGQSKITEVAAELEEISELLRGNRAFREFASSPIIDKKARSDSLRHIFADRVTDLTLRFLLVLNDNGRLRHLESVAGAFDRLVHDAFGRVEVDVFTAAPLAQDELTTVKDRIRKALGREPVLHPYTETAMIGGIKLRIGDQLIDGSVSNLLRRMKRNLQNTGGSQLRERINRIIQEGGA